MQRIVGGISTLVLPAWLFAAAAYAASAGEALSEDSEVCMACHLSVNPGIAADWKASLHARGVPAEALQKDDLERRVSAAVVPDGMAPFNVGCAECHCLNPQAHKDTFEHNGYRVHVVVTPDDCATCHATEADQYARNIMAHAHGNLARNPVFRDLADSVNGGWTFENGETILRPPDAMTDADSCNIPRRPLPPFPSGRLPGPRAGPQPRSPARI